MTDSALVGVISDTHGLVRPEAIDALRGADVILHGGDIGKPEVIDELGSLARVVAIRGNVDTGEWANAYPETRTEAIAGRHIYMLHDLKALAFDPAGEGIDVVVAGHSHKPLAQTRGGVLYLNPGSAGPRRFSLPVSVALLSLSAEGVEARLIELDVSTSGRGKRK